jgi:hypothetical protein
LISFFESPRSSNANAYTNNSLDFHVARKMQQGLKIYRMKRGEILGHSSFSDTSFDAKRFWRRLSSAARLTRAPRGSTIIEHFGASG